MRKLIAVAFKAGVSWHENKSVWAGTEAAWDAAEEYAEGCLPASLPRLEQLKDVVRATGYATHDQAWEIAEGVHAVAFPDFDEDVCRTDFESMAAICYPGALSAGRNEIHGTYINSNLEKRWKGWKACEEFRSGIVPTQQRGKSA